MPGLPGVTITSAVRPSTCARQCSRPPEPTTTTFMTGPPATPVAASGVAMDELLAARTNPDQGHGHPHLCFEECKIRLGGGGQLMGLGDVDQRRLPTGQLFVDR